MAVELTEGWWKTAWPKDTKPKCFDAVKLAIKNTKAAKRGLSATGYIDQLFSLEKFIPKLRAEAKSQFRKDQANLKKTEKMLDEFEKLIAKSKAGVKMDSKPRIVYARAFGDALKDKVAKHSEKYLHSLPKIEVKLQLMGWLVDELADKNAANQLHKAIDREFLHTVEKTANFVDKYARTYVLDPIHKDAKSHLSVVHDQIKDNVAELNETLKKVPAEVLRKIGISAKVAKQYKIDQGIDVATSTVGAGLAVAGLALPGTPAFAAAAACRALIGLAKEIAAISMSLDKKVSIFEEYLVALEKMFADAESERKKMNIKDGAKELALSGLNSLIGIDVMPTMKKATDGLKKIEGHIALLDDRSNRMVAKINEVIDSQAKFKKQMTDATSAKAFQTAFGQLKDAERDLNRMLKIASGVTDTVAKAESDLVKIQRTMKTLKQPGTLLKKAQTGVDVLINNGMAQAGYWDACLVGKDFTSFCVAYSGAYLEAGNTIKNNK